MGRVALRRQILSLRRTAAPKKAGSRHCLHVAEQADMLLASSGHLLGLTKTARPLLYAAALLHDAPSAEQPEALEKALRRAHLPFSAGQRRIIAQAVALLPMTTLAAMPNRRPAADKSAMERQIAVRMAAILRIAHALDYAKGQNVQIVAVADDGQAMDVLVAAGRSGRTNIPLALEQAALWNSLARRPIRAIRAVDAKAAPAPLIRGGDSTSAAANRLLQRLADQFVSRLHGLAYDDDPEYVHELRVAIRRLRGAMRVFGRALNGGMERARQRLSALSDALGEARDADVFELFLRGYCQHAPSAHQPYLRRLARSQSRKGRKAHRQMVELFGRPSCVRFVAGLGRRSGPSRDVGWQASGKSAARPIRKTAARIIRDHLRTVLKYGPDLRQLPTPRQHALRIDCKKLRYAVELLSDLYGKALNDVTDAMVAMQDSLGEAHDAELYVQHVRDLCPGRPTAPQQALLRHLLALSRRRLAKAEKIWETFTATNSGRQIKRLL